MTISYTWVFPAFDTAPVEGEVEDVIKVVHWRLTATEDDYNAEVYGTVSLDAPGEDFTPFEEITKEMVEDWVSDVLDVDSIKAGLATQIAGMIEPPIVAKPAPWA